MSGAARRLQRRGHPVVGERLEGVQAHYRNAKGDAFTVQLDSRSGIDVQQLYGYLSEVVTDTIDVSEAFEQLDAVAAEPFLRKQRLPLERAVHTLLNVYWLEYHGHLVTDEHNGILFAFSRRDQKNPGKLVGFFRRTLDPTPGQETAFARAIERARERP